MARIDVKASASSSVLKATALAAQTAIPQEQNDYKNERLAREDEGFGCLTQPLHLRIETTTLIKKTNINSAQS